ncbi:hypothetical protein RCL1_000500 [Eukaryota sp. TZLM3-RCL]
MSAKDLLSDLDSAFEDDEILSEEDMEEAVDPSSDTCLLALTECNSLLSSKQFQEFISKVSQPLVTQSTNLHVDLNPITLLVSEAAKYSTLLEDYVFRLRRFICDSYSSLIPELSSLFPSPLHTALVALSVGPTPSSVLFPAHFDMDNINSPLLLNKIERSTILAFRTSSSTISGSLSPEIYSNISKSAELILKVEQIRTDLVSVVERHCPFLLPNLSILLTPSVAASLLAHAGNLTALAKISANDLRLVGKKLTVSVGLSSYSSLPHAGVIANSPLVKSAPLKYRMKALRVTTCRAALLIRLDLFGRERFGAGVVARQFLTEIEEKINNWITPPLLPPPAPLPIPIKKKGTRRAGRALRAYKNRLAPTELREARNRVSFAETRGDFDVSEEDQGIIGTSFVGKIKINTKQQEKLAQQRRLATNKRLEKIDKKVNMNQLFKEDDE